MATHAKCSNRHSRRLKSRGINNAVLFRVILLLFFVTGILCTQAQTTITGYTLNDKGDTIPFATVKFLPAPGSPAKSFAISSAHGWYSLTLSKDNQTGLLEISAVGYNTAWIPLDSILPGRTFTTVLHPLDHALPEVLIKSTPPIRISGDTVSFKAAAFARGNERTIGSLLANIPGFVVQDNGKITFNGEPIDKILIEGDDLTSKNYEMLVKNLSPTGIDKLEVLKNYQDPENISSPMMKVNRQVLNLRFKNSLICKVFGTAEASVGAPIKDYTLDAQAVSLIKKLKFITMDNSNTSGDTRIPSRETAGGQPPADKDDITQITPADNTPLAYIDDLKSSWSRSPLIAANNSQQSTLTGLARIGRHIILKANTDLRRDRYDQQTTTTKNIFTPTQTININEFQNVHKVNTLFSNNISLNYTDSKNNQLILLLQNNHLACHDFRNGTLNGLPMTDNNNDNNDQYNGKLSCQHIFRKAALGFSLRYSLNTLPGRYMQTPALYDSFFYHGDPHVSILQHEHQRFSTQAANAFLIRRLSHNSITIDLSYTHQQGQLFNSIDSMMPTIANDITNRSSEINLGFRDVIAWTSRLSTTLSGNLLYFKEELDPALPSGKKGSLKKTVFLPGLSVNYQLSRLDKLSFSFSGEHTTPQLRNNAPGYIVNGLTSIARGNDTLRSAISHSAQFLFSHFDPLNHRWLFFMGAVFQQNPYLYLPQQFPNPLYTYSVYAPSSNNLTTASVFGRVDKFFADMHSKISPQLTYTKVNTYGIVDAVKTGNTFGQLKLGIDLIAGLHALDLGGGYSYSLSEQKSSGNNPVTHTREMEINFRLDWKLTSRIFFDIKTRASRVYPPGQPPINAVSSSSEITYKSSNEKWEWELQCTNILDQRSYSYSVITPLQTSVQQYELFPRRLAVGMRYRF